MGTEAAYDQRKLSRAQRLRQIQPLDRGAELIALQGPPNLHDEFVGVLGRLGHVVVGAEAHGVNGRLNVPVAREDDHGDVRSGRLEPAQGLQAIQAGHPEIEDDDLRWKRLDLIQRRLAVLGGDDVEAFDKQDSGERLPDGSVIVHDQDPR